MTKRLKILFPILALCLITQFGHSHIKSKAYDTFKESDHCRMFPTFVMELGLKKAIGLQALRNDNEDQFFLIIMAKWLGTEDAARDCVDIEK